MRIPRNKIDVVSMVSATHQASRAVTHVIAMAERMQDDSNREIRIRESLCRWCYYSRGRLGGAAMTEHPCSLCGTNQIYGSTATDELCLPCAKEHSLCKRCGGDREMRTLRRKWPTALPTSSVLDRPTAPDDRTVLEQDEDLPEKE